MTRFWTIRGRRSHRHWLKQLWRNSAEGKAIARLEAMERGEISEEDFRIAVESATEADIDESLKQLKKRGYSTGN